MRSLAPCGVVYSCPQLIAFAQSVCGLCRWISRSPRKHAPHVLRVAHKLKLICCLIPSPRPTGVSGTHLPQDKASMSTRIHIGNLPYFATDRATLTAVHRVR